MCTVLPAEEIQSSGATVISGCGVVVASATAALGLTGVAGSAGASCAAATLTGVGFAVKVDDGDGVGVCVCVCGCGVFSDVGGELLGLSIGANSVGLGVATGAVVESFLDGSDCESSCESCAPGFTLAAVVTIVVGSW